VGLAKWVQLLMPSDVFNCARSSVNIEHLCTKKLVYKTIHNFVLFLEFCSILMFVRDRKGDQRGGGGLNGSLSKIHAIESSAYDPKFTGEYQYRIAQDGYRHLQYPQSEYEHT